MPPTNARPGATHTGADADAANMATTAATAAATQQSAAAVPLTRLARYRQLLHFGQLMRFGVVGVLGTAVNVAILHVLHNELGWGFTRSSAIATELAILHNYVWNELWTFHIKRLHLGRMLRYQTSSMVAFCVTVGVATLAKEAIDPRLAQLVGILAGAGINYAVNVRWTWGPRATVHHHPTDDRNEERAMLADQLQSDLQTAMKARDRSTVDCLRMVIAGIKEVRTSPGHTGDVTDDEVQALLRREARRREEGIATFTEAGREDLASRERAELDVLKRYLPAEMSDDDLAAIIDATIAETGASAPGDIGRVMGAVMPKLQGQAAGNRVNALVRERLDS